jgi:hypothetical protein
MNKNTDKYKNSDPKTSIFISNQLNIDIIKITHTNILDEVWEYLELILKCLSIDNDLRSSILNITIKNSTILLNYNFNPSLEKDILKYDIFSLKTFLPNKFCKNFGKLEKIINCIRDINNLNVLTPKSDLTNILKCHSDNKIHHQFKIKLYIKMVKWLTHQFYAFQKGRRQQKIDKTTYYYLFISTYTTENSLSGLIQNYNVEKLLQTMYNKHILKYIDLYREANIPDINYNKPQPNFKTFFLENIFYKIDEETINPLLQTFSFTKRINIDFPTPITYNTSLYVENNICLKYPEFKPILNEIFGNINIERENTIILNTHVGFLNSMLTNTTITTNVDFYISETINLELYRVFHRNYYEIYTYHLAYKSLNYSNIYFIDSKALVLIHNTIIIDIQKTLGFLLNIINSRRKHLEYFFYLENVDYLASFLKIKIYQKILLFHINTNIIKNYIINTNHRNNYIKLRSLNYLSIVIRRYIDRNYVTNILKSKLYYFILRTVIYTRYMRLRKSVLFLENVWINHNNRKKYYIYRIQYYKRLADARQTKIMTLENIIKNILHNHKLILASKELEITGMRDTIKSYNKNIEDRINEKIQLTNQLDSLRHERNTLIISLAEANSIINRNKKLPWF